MPEMRPSAARGVTSVTTWLNASFEMRFRFIGGLTVRFAASEGRSDQALLLSPWLLSPRAMGEFIVAAADAFGLEHPHVVAPGTGTAAALFAAARHPGRLRSLVVGSGAAAVPLQLERHACSTPSAAWPPATRCAFCQAMSRGR
jgi:pimeloyl-ACP methyl ester carboxylesterase